MIIVNVYGGLGNQMFQYALGRHLAHKLKTDLKFDYSVNLTRTDFDPQDITSIFDIFKVKNELASEEEIKKFNRPSDSANCNQILRGILSKYFAFIKSKYNLIKESDFYFNENILSASNHCYLSGYWQSEKYFLGVEKLIREDFQIKIPMQENNKIFAKKIINSESISIHLRGRDYITRERTKEVHFTCDSLYYERCISLITTKVKKPQFFIFSDDPEWARDFLKTDIPLTFVEGNSWNKTNYEDLRLMSLCKHNIIANSSFSWWGAWLNSNPEKIVIAPRRWFADDEANKQTKDLIPDKWIRL